MESCGRLLIGHARRGARTLRLRRVAPSSAAPPARRHLSAQRRYAAHGTRVNNPPQLDKLPYIELPDVVTAWWS
jgi:hypothetical protein